MSLLEGNSLTEGDLKRPMFELAWSTIVTEPLQVAYNLTDTIWSDRLSIDAVATVSLASPLIFLLISVGDDFAVAGSALAAQYAGAESEGSVGIAAEQTLALITVIVVVVDVVGFFATGTMLGILPSLEATAGQVIPLTGGYMRVFLLGLPFLFGFLVFPTLMRGYGNTHASMVMMFISVVVNIIVDLALIFGFDANLLFSMLGVEGLQASLFATTSFDSFKVAGAAYATVLSRIAATAIGIYVIFGTSASPDMQLADLRPQSKHIKQVIDIGIPSAIEQSATALGFTTLTVMAVVFSPKVVAAFGLGNCLTPLVLLPALGLERATNTIVGQNLGAQKPERAEGAVRFAAKVGTSVTLVTGALTYIFAEPIVTFPLQTRTASAAQAIDLGVEYIRICVVELGFIGVLQVILNAYRGTGNTKTALDLSLFALWLDRVPIVYLLSFQFGLAETGIWLGMVIEQTLDAIVTMAWFIRRTWKHSVVDADAVGT